MSRKSQILAAIITRSIETWSMFEKSDGSMAIRLVRFNTSDVEPRYGESLSNIRPLSLLHLTADFAHAIRKKNNVTTNRLILIY